jgi:hypothetical protein
MCSIHSTTFRSQSVDDDEKEAFLCQHILMDDEISTALPFPYMDRQSTILLPYGAAVLFESEKKNKFQQMIIASSSFVFSSFFFVTYIHRIYFFPRLVVSIHPFFRLSTPIFDFHSLRQDIGFVIHSFSLRKTRHRLCQ